MLTDNRKRHRSCDSEEERQLSPQAKRSGVSPTLLVSDLDSESSSSDSSNGISSPDSAIVVTTIHNSIFSLSPKAVERDGYSYDSINRVLKEAHFSSLQSRGHPGST